MMHGTMSLKFNCYFLMDTSLTLVPVSPNDFEIQTYKPISHSPVGQHKEKLWLSLNHVQCFT